MQYQILTGIHDYDPKGLSGVGTIHWLEIRKGDALIERHLYGLLDVIGGKFDPETIKAPYREANANMERDEREAAKLERQKAAEERETTVVDDPVLLEIIRDVIANETKLVSDYRAGKDKAINAMVGRVIGQTKNRGMGIDAFVINRLLMKELK